MDNRYEIAEKNGMSREFADWFFDNKKSGCGNVWFMMMAAMWEGWQGRAAMLQGVEPVTTAYKLRDAVDAIRNSGIEIDAEKILAERDALNSPAIPDGWVACSERMPENKPGSYEYIVFETLNNRAHHDYWNVPDVGDDAFTPFWNHYGEYVTHWMPLPAAPQQEE